MRGPFDPERAEQCEVTIDRMPVRRNIDDFIVEIARAFPRIGEPDNAPAFSPAELRDQRTAQEALEIEHESGVDARTKLSRPRKNAQRSGQSAKIAPRKIDDFIDVRIAFEQRRPFRVDDPADARLGPVLFDRCDRRQRVDDVAERTRFYDQDVANFRFQISDFRFQIEFTDGIPI